MPFPARLFTRLLAILLFACPPLLAQPGQAVVPAKNAAELEARITRILAETRVPGASAVIANRTGLVWTAGIGKADVATGEAVTPDTLFRIGSISKTFAGLAALKLVEEGRLDLNAPVRSLVPEVAFTNPWEATHPVRVVHLLEHTTGWDNLHFKEYASSDPSPLTLAGGLALGPESRTSRWRPGTRFAYCNSGPAVTAAIIEKLTGQRFEDYVAEAFFKPIGMPTADYFHSPRTRSLLTKLYHGDGHTPYPYWHLAMRPSGAINASAREMGAYLRFFLRRGEGSGQRILSEASLRRMETPTTSWAAQGGLKTGYGLHNFTSVDDRGFVWHGHNGAVDGGLSQLAYLPESGLGYFFSINGEAGEAFERINAQMQAYVTQDLAKPTLPPIQPLEAAATREFQGWYHTINPQIQNLAFLEQVGNLVHVSFEGNRMRISPWIAPSQFLVGVEGLRFRREDQGVAGAVLMKSEDGRLLAVGRGSIFAQVHPAQAWTGIVGTVLFLLALLSVPGFALVWGIRWLCRRMRGVPNLHVRVLPLLAVLSLVAVVVILILANEDTMARMGYRTPWSVGLWAATWAFAAFSAASLWAALRAGLRGEWRGMNRLAYAHSLGVSLIFTITTLYLAYWGIIGIRTWA